MTDNEALIPRIKAILADLRATSAESFQLQRLVVDYTERTVTSNDRERIAELERDLAHANAGLAKMNKMADEDSDTINGLRANLAQNAAITETLRAEYDADIGSLLRIAKNISTVGNDADDVPDYRRLKAKWRSDLATPVVEEEQGPWVIYDEGPSHEGLKFCGREGWRDGPPGLPFSKRSTAQDIIEDFGSGNERMRVITLAEAHRITGAK